MTTTVVGTGRLRAYANFVKIEHTIFSLPLILAGTVLHDRAWPEAELFWLILLAAVGARVLAMGLNRIIDAKIDARNPRTRQRELARGAIGRPEAWAIVLAAGGLYAYSAWAIAPVCFQLAPIPVVLFVIYPYLKRFTFFAHLGLGLAWSMAPLGGWLAASQRLVNFSEVGWLWAFSVLWVAGFDIIYATLDEAFDRKAGLHSLPSRLGRRPALRVALCFHLFAFWALVEMWLLQFAATPLAFGVLGGIAALLWWQHAIADRRPEVAFFRPNAIVGFAVLILVMTGV